MDQTEQLGAEIVVQIVVDALALLRRGAFADRVLARSALLFECRERQRMRAAFAAPARREREQQQPEQREQ